MAGSYNDNDDNKDTTTKTVTTGVVPNVISRNAVEDLDDDDDDILLPPSSATRSTGVVGRAEQGGRVKLFQLDNVFENDAKMAN